MSADQELLDRINSRNPFAKLALEQLDGVIYCLHCNGSFKWREVKFETWKIPEGVEDFEAVSCPCDGCDGNIIDFKDSPWYPEDTSSDPDTASQPID